MPNPVGQQSAAGSVSTVRSTAPTNPLIGQRKITTGGTAVQIPAGSLPITEQITVRALSANVGKVYVGSSAVTATNGYELSAGEAVKLRVANGNVLYVNGPTANDGVCYIGN